MGETSDAERFIAEWRDTGGSELANTQSFINGLCRLIGVEPPRGSRTDDAQNDYVFERRVFQENGDGTRDFGRTLNAFARWLAVRRDEWAAWGRQVELTGYEAFDRYLRARIEAEPYGEPDATIVRIAKGSREIIVGQSVSGPSGYGEEMLYRHIFRTPKARKRFMAWLDRDGSLSRMHELVALAFQRGTAALGEALDEIADRSGTSKPSDEQARQPRSLLAG